MLKKNLFCSILPIRAPAVFPRLPDGTTRIFLPPYATAGFRTRVSSVASTRVLARLLYHLSYRTSSEEDA